MTTDFGRDAYQALEDLGWSDEQRAELAADLQALADVRTLDGLDPDWSMAGRTSAETGSEFRLCYVPALDQTFEGVTAGEARAKAAAWVRGLR